jgi:hypothetical protein
MMAMRTYATKASPDLRQIKGIAYPRSVRFSQILVTGPSGSGKSTHVGRLGGWPEEGCLDLGRRCWWRSRVLALRPREIHLHLPWQPQRLMQTQGAVAVTAELERLPMPPDGSCLLAPSWRRRFLFEFLLPEPEQIFEKRQERARSGSHPVDRNLSLEQVQAQLRVYEILARHLHRNGFQVLVRHAYDGPPLEIDDPIMAPRAPNSLLAQALRASPPTPGGVRT